MTTPLRWPDSLRNVKVLTPRPNLFNIVGLEYLIFLPLYAYVIQWCVDTSGEPYAAALSHYESLQNETTVVAAEPIDEWDMPSWQPEKHDPFAELDPEDLLSDDKLSDLEFDLEMMKDDPLLSSEAAVEELEKPSKPLPNPLMPNFWAVLSLIGVVLANALMWFIQRWLISVRVFFKYQKAPRLALGTYAYITPHPHQGAAEIVPVCCVTIKDETPPGKKSGAGEQLLFVMFQRQRFEVVEEQQELKPLDCAVDRPLVFYTGRAQGLSSQAAVDAQRARFGSNSLHIPSPLFQDIFKKQMLGPVPVFQILCTSLWLMDEYWNYALFNVFSICMFEGSTAFGRLKNLSTLRGMRNQATQVQVRRGGVWSLVSTEELVPGDVFTLRSADAQDPVVPCDALLLQGAAVANEATLTGESTPQMKEAVVSTGAAGEDLLDIVSAHRVYTLYSGTSLMQHTSPPPDVMKRLGVSDGGCLCYCLRTGFTSSQGQLVRMIEYSSEQVMSDVKETLALLFVLLVFALISSGYVLREGLREGKRSQYELVLRCVLILTSVVPPELPMQTAVAVNTALLALWKTAIFCTEPFRIPYAGKVEVCLFDKTGTLTTDHLVCIGTVNFQQDQDHPKPSSASASSDSPQPVTPVAAASWEVCMVLGGCHAIVKIGNKVCGDPMETESIKALGWEYNPASATCTPGATAVASMTKGASLRVLHRYHFSSKLQRMTVLAKMQRGGGSSSKGSGEGGFQTCVLVKGSPEAVARLLATKPPGYESSYRSMAENGIRVIALAWRVLAGSEGSEAAELAASGKGVPREELEQGLSFAGFVAFSCKVRKDSGIVVRELQAGSHRVLMATGDAALTALHVAAKVGITNRLDPFKALVLQAAPSGGGLHWSQMRLRAGECEKDRLSFPYSAASLRDLSKRGFDLCVTGDAMRAAMAEEETQGLTAESKGPKSKKRKKVITGFLGAAEMVGIYARMAPEDKERVIRALRERGIGTLMCGDGANDVGALKQADVGVALLSGFGGANTAKEGEKALEDETAQEKQTRMAKAMEDARGKAKQAQEDRKKDTAEIQLLQKQWYEQELRRLEAEGDSWAAFKAAKSSMGMMIAEQKKRAKARNPSGAGGNIIAAQASAMAADAESGEVPSVKLGDASVAAPFTSKLPSIQSTVDVIRQGRCTLVSTIQMQQILALNCLICAYSLSALYLDGVRSGEAQMIASGVLLTVASLAFSYARPVKELSPVRPITSLFHPAISLSIAGQLLIHLYCMVSSISLAKSSSSAAELEDFLHPELAAPPPPPPPNPDGTQPLLAPFTPTLINTVVFLVETAQQVSVMAVNYKGRPFMLASTENRPMLYSLALCCAGTFLAAFEVLPQLNTLLQLVPLPSDEFRYSLLRTLGLSVGGSFLWDRLCVALFAPRLMLAGYKDAWKAFRSKDNIDFFAKAAIGLVVAGVYVYTQNVFLIMGAYYFYRKFSKPNENAASAPPAAAAALSSTPAPSQPSVTTNKRRN